MKKVTLGLLTIIGAGLFFAPQALAAEPDNAKAEADINSGGGTLWLSDVPELQFTLNGTQTSASAGKTSGTGATLNSGQAIGDLVVKDTRPTTNTKGWTVSLQAADLKINTTAILPTTSLTFGYGGTYNGGYTSKVKTFAAANVLKTTLKIVEGQSAVTDRGSLMFGSGYVNSTLTLSSAANTVPAGIYSGALTYTIAESTT